MRYTPSNGSWLNVVEGFFRTLDRLLYDGTDRRTSPSSANLDRYPRLWTCACDGMSWRIQRSMACHCMCWCPIGAERSATTLVSASELGDARGWGTIPSRHVTWPRPSAVVRWLREEGDSGNSPATELSLAAVLATDQSADVFAMAVP
jgi:hypothetical protein